MNEPKQVELEEVDLKATGPRKAVVVEHLEGIQEAAFRPGVYEHWKGGLYYALAIGWINEVEPRERAVFYLSLTTGEWHARPYTSQTKDAWLDNILVEAVAPAGEPSARVQWWTRRFRYVGPQPVPPT